MNSNLHTESGGPKTGPAILLLHGVTRQIADLAPVIERLPKSIGWIAVDFPGHGKSPAANHHYKVRDYTADILNYISNSVRRPLILFGHSLGAMVAAQVAASAKKLVAGAILEDPPFSTMGSKIKESMFYLQFKGLSEAIWLSGWYKDQQQGMVDGLRELPVNRPSDGAIVRLGDLRSDEAIRTYAQYLLQFDFEALNPIVAGEWLDGYDMPAIASKINCPVLLLQADETCGGMLTDQEAAQFASTAPNCNLKKIAGAPHLIHATHLDLLASEIDSFLKSLP